MNVDFGKSGIYKITNTVNGKIYVGQSVDVRKRITGHKYSLGKGIHRNSYLQHSYNKHGDESFLFSLLELCDLDVLTRRENYWMKTYESYNRELGYNLQFPNEDETAHVKSSESKKKQSDAMTKFSKDELVSYLQEFYYMEGRTPNQRDFAEKQYGEYPSFTVFYQNFGSLKNALVEADIFDFADNKEQFDQKEYTRDEILENYQAFININDRLPNTRERRKSADYNLISESTVIREFGGFGRFKLLLGFTKEREIELENQRSLVSLLELYNEKGFITARIIDKSTITRSTKFYLNRFGSLFNAYELAGIAPEENPVTGHSYLGNYAKFKQTKSKVAQ